MASSIAGSSGTASTSITDRASSGSSSSSGPSSSPRPTPPPYATLLSGAVSGFTSCVLLQPFDLLKTRLQQADGQTAKLGGKTNRLLRTIEGVVEKDGVKGLWRGTWPTVLRNVPGVALYFYSVTELRRLLAVKPIAYLSSPLPLHALPPSQQNSLDPSHPPPPLAKATSTGNLLAGAIARVTVGFILCPITVLKTRFESSLFPRSQNATLLLSLKAIWAEGGVRGLFRGFSATAMRDAPYAGLYLMLYEKGKTILEEGVGVGKEEGEEWKGRVASGLIAGTLATALTHPFDILKTRLQTALPTPSTSGVTNLPSAATLRSTLTSIIQKEGISSLFLDGLGLRCARKGLSSAIGWGLFEGGRDWWVKREVGRRRTEVGEVKVER